MGRKQTRHILVVERNILNQNIPNFDLNVNQKAVSVAELQTVLLGLNVTETSIEQVFTCEKTVKILSKEIEKLSIKNHVWDLAKVLNNANDTLEQKFAMLQTRVNIVSFCQHNQAKAQQQVANQELQRELAKQAEQQRLAEEYVNYDPAKYTLSNILRECHYSEAQIQEIFAHPILIQQATNLLVRAELYAYKRNKNPEKQEQEFRKIFAASIKVLLKRWRISRRDVEITNRVLEMQAAFDELTLRRQFSHLLKNNKQQLIEILEEEPFKLSSAVEKAQDLMSKHDLFKRKRSKKPEGYTTNKKLYYLGMLFDRNEPMTTKEIAKFMSQKESLVRIHMRQLEKKGLVEKSESMEIIRNREKSYLGEVQKWQIAKKGIRILNENTTPGLLASQYYKKQQPMSVVEMLFEERKVRFKPEKLEKLEVESYAEVFAKRMYINDKLKDWKWYPPLIKRLLTETGINEDRVIERIQKIEAEEKIKNKGAYLMQMYKQMTTEEYIEMVAKNQLGNISSKSRELWEHLVMEENASQQQIFHSACRIKNSGEKLEAKKKKLKAKGKEVEAKKYEILESDIQRIVGNILHPKKAQITEATAAIRRAIDQKSDQKIGQQEGRRNFTMIPSSSTTRGNIVKRLLPSITREQLFEENSKIREKLPKYIQNYLKIAA